MRWKGARTMTEGPGEIIERYSNEIKNLKEANNSLTAENVYLHHFLNLEIYKLKSYAEKLVDTLEFYTEINKREAVVKYGRRARMVISRYRKDYPKGEDE